MRGDENGVLVGALSSSLHHGGNELANIPVILKRVLADGAWRRFVDDLGKLHEHSSFEEFATTKPLAGLGSDVALIRRIVADDTAVVDLLDQAMQRPAGHPILDNIQDKAPTGTSEDAALRRLRKDQPELHADVLAGRLKAHAAMVKAGYRPRTISVPVERPEAVAAALRRHMSQDDLAQLIGLLGEP